MVHFLVLAAVTAVAIADLPSPAPGPLREIGGARSYGGVCGNLALHANGAIAATLRNDGTLTRAIRALRAVDLEGNPMARRNGLAELGRFSSDIRDEAGRADGELKRLRDLSDKTSDDAHKAQVQSFADALGSALSRQRKVAADLGSFLSFLDMQSMREMPVTDRSDGLARSPGDGQQGRPVAPIAVPTSGSLFEHGSPNQAASATAADFEARMPELASDEARAADHSEAAVSGC